MNRSKYQWVFIIVLMLCSHVSLAVPNAINYQGYLTDTAGIPVDGTVNITFRIYAASVAGVPLWSDAQSVAVSKGLFSVELGGGTFPATLFEAPIWLGVTVESDNEMSPRKAFNSVTFAFKADDAETVGGLGSAALNQSSHVIDTANPHNVSAAQAGAADAAILNAHASDSGNPHNVTVAQTGAADNAGFNAHTGNAGAHHAPYTDASAVAAMGAQSNSNTFNHNRYADANVVAAVLAADGAGSILDADLVDGLQASEMIDAASDEVRTPINALPYTITQSGSYYLTGNLSGASGGIDINADDVTLDLMGFTISHSGFFSDYGIYFHGRSNITIRNGTVKGFPLAGIYQGDINARFATVIDVQALGNGTVGSGTTHSGMYLRSSNSLVERCTAGDNGGYGIFVETSSRLINNTVYNNAGFAGLYAARGSSLIGNIAYNNSSTYAIYGAHGSILRGNTAYNNSGLYAIFGNVGARIMDNTARNNATWGIYGEAANLIKNNIVNNNNTSSTLGGMRVGGYSRVTNNALDGNSLNNIIIDSTGSVIKNNHVTDSSNGILFQGFSGNYYRDNTSAGNTKGFNLFGTFQVDGGGNIEF